MFVAIVTILAVAAAPQTAAATTGACAGASERRDVAVRVHSIRCLVNRARASHGLVRLTANAPLALAAQRHAADMVDRTYFEHTSPGGSTPLQRVRRAGYRGHRIGETIAFALGPEATPGGAVRAWLTSPRHRRILLDRPMRDLGVGFARGVPLKIRGASGGATVVLDVGAR